MVPSIFRNLSENEYAQLIDAVPLISILIAGCDGEIDLKEKQWAEKITGIRTYSHYFEVKPLYQDLDKQFTAKFDQFVSELPIDVAARNKEISNRLSALNNIFSKLPMSVSSKLYNSYLSLAEQVARSSGGFLRMMAKSREENEWVGLPMLDPIFYEEFDEEE
ncbi:MAG TPA: hypothetical protein PK006_11230 [Saprospiraceae bacterium]|nr:hypothetical protein [Saprospiraceae bacterium]